MQRCANGARFSLRNWRVGSAMKGPGLFKLRRFEHLRTHRNRIVEPDSLIREEEEQLVLENRPPDAAREIAIFLVHPVRTMTGNNLELAGCSGFTSNLGKRYISRPIELVERV